jgi:hypothetical protein
VSLTVAEANAVYEITDWLTSLDLFEVNQNCVVDDASLTDAVDVLVRGARKRLGAGAEPGDVVRQLSRVLAGGDR